MTELYKITGKLLELQNLDAGDDANLKQAVVDTLDAIEGEFQDKAVSVAHFIRNLEPDIKAVDTEIKRLQARKKTLENRQEQVTDYLRENMERTGIKNISCPLFSISYVKGRETAAIEDESALPDEYVDVKTEVKPNKASITKALKAGVNIPGARLEHTKSSIRIK
ncbi:siphovirus Gp157 family protein [Hahella sp. HN01]|uniref:siphovirus Gp157 family protein n=1 Tax=Hahella sp. HN01 TaxID=2847262 RepID=UPI001C1F1BB1|nr:siphovirus Gp157 family protein [Hahella sp. HN01]MBU6956094.1 siphovirus Gp157 family protein [Hahella sp. HN01]